MVPVVTIDGPSGSGKGTIAGLLAQRLGWHCLDSGALYRLLGLAAERAAISADQTSELEHIARTMEVEFSSDGIHLGGEDVTRAIRTEQAGNAASKVAAIPKCGQPFYSGSATMPDCLAWWLTAGIWALLSSLMRE